MRSLAPAALAAVATIAGLGAGCESGDDTTPWTDPLAIRRDALYKVESVDSGDTLTLRYDDAGRIPYAEAVAVRLLGVESPAADESRNPVFAEEARAELARLVSAGWVRLEFDNEENRPPRRSDESLATPMEAFVFALPPSRGVQETLTNSWILERGFGRRRPTARLHAGPASHYLERLDQAEARARASRQGLWLVSR
ncbi:MAG: hypothetical protein L0216_13905 [Planctomycetales bacterium]|nr:hypothetical protein [Planctomycetales bacterium]